MFMNMTTQWAILLIALITFPSPHVRPPHASYVQRSARNRLDRPAIYTTPTGS